jgi:hypothetical protein
MDATVPRLAQEPHPKQRPRLRLLLDMKLITWLFSLATRAVLLSILVGVLGFLTLFAYFLLGQTWSMPAILSAGNERVVQVQRDWLERRLKLADLDSRVQVLRRQLLEIENSMEIAHVAASAEANTIRTDAKQNDLEIEVVRNAIARGTSERHNASNTQAIVEGKVGGLLSHRELEYLKAWNEAILKLRTGSDEVQHLRQSLEHLGTLRTELLDSLRPLADSPLVAAAHEPAVVVFVPYDNVATFKPGQPIYNCRLGLVLCSPIGTTGRFVDGEITLQHPFFRRVIRGSFYSVELRTDKQAAQNLLLFSAPPLLF